MNNFIFENKTKVYFGNITAGCCKKLTHDEIYDILCECK